MPLVPFRPLPLRKRRDKEAFVCTLMPSRVMSMSVAAVSTSQVILSLEEQIARQQALLEASRQVHSTIVAEEVLSRTARILVRELELEGALFLPAEGGAPLARFGTLPEPPYGDCPRWKLLSREGTVLAELVVARDQSEPNDPMDMSEQDFVEGLVLQAAVALETAHHHERTLMWARVEQDLAAARKIQQSLLPRSMPSIPGFSIAGRSSTCYEVGGDYLDTVPLGNGAELLIVADVAGKGLASAIVATSFRAAFRSLVTQPLPLVEVVNRMGQHHWEEGQEARQRYVTAIFVRLNPGGCELEVVNAGHNPAILALPDGSTQMIEASAPPLGMLPGVSYRAETFMFPRGARLLLYTDGLTEVFCGEDEFGCERLTSAFRDAPSSEAAEILDSLWAELASFAVQGPQTDDMTALAVCHRGPTAQENDIS